MNVDEIKLEKIDILKKNLSDDELRNHIIFSLNKLFDLIYSEKHKIETILDRKFIVNFKSGLKEKQHKRRYNNQHLENISDLKFNFFKHKSEEKKYSPKVMIHYGIYISREIIDSTKSWWDYNKTKYEFRFPSYYYSFDKDEYLIWIKKWSKKLKKKIIKFLFFLQENNYTDKALLIFFDKLNKNFDFYLNASLNDKIGDTRRTAVNSYHITSISHIIPTAEYRRCSISKLLKGRI